MLSTETPKMSGRMGRRRATAEPLEELAKADLRRHRKPEAKLAARLRAMTLDGIAERLPMDCRPPAANCLKRRNDFLQFSPLAGTDTLSVARLAVAQAAIEEKRKAKVVKKK